MSSLLRAVYADTSLSTWLHNVPPSPPVSADLLHSSVCYSVSAIPDADPAPPVQLSTGKVADCSTAVASSPAHSAPAHADGKPSAATMEPLPRQVAAHAAARPFVAPSLRVRAETSSVGTQGAGGRLCGVSAGGAAEFVRDLGGAASSLPGTSTAERKDCGEVERGTGSGNNNAFLNAEDSLGRGPAHVQQFSEMLGVAGTPEIPGSSGNPWMQGMPGVAGVPRVPGMVGCRIGQGVSGMQGMQGMLGMQGMVGFSGRSAMQAAPRMPGIPQMQISPSSVSGGPFDSALAMNQDGGSSACTASLFIPIFRKQQYLLGELYGDQSPNALALVLLRGGSDNVKPLARRFVADLGAMQHLQFIEYEWFGDGILVVSDHTVELNGDYVGESIMYSNCLADSCGAVSPGRCEMMRLKFKERRDCGLCGQGKERCSCTDAYRATFTPGKRQKKSSWTDWIRAFIRTRNSNSTVTTMMQFNMPFGPIRTQSRFRVCNSASTDVSNTKALLQRRFLTQISATISHPAQDKRLVDGFMRDQVANEAEIIEAFSAQCLPPVPSQIQGDQVSQVLSSEATTTQLTTTQQKTSVRGISNEIEASISTKESPPGASAVSSRQSRTARPTGGVKKQFVCHCGAKFAHKGHFNEHDRAVHRGLKPHQCLICPSSFAKKYDLSRHVAAVHGVGDTEERFPCSMCTVVFRHRTQVALHYRAVHDIKVKPFACEVDECTQSFATKQGVRKHMTAKHPGVPIDCTP